MPVERAPAAVVAHRRARICVTGSVLDVPERDAGVEGAVMKLCRRLCGLIRFVIPARRASRLTVRSAA